LIFCGRSNDKTVFDPFRERFPPLRASCTSLAALGEEESSSSRIGNFRGTGRSSPRKSRPQQQPLSEVIANFSTHHSAATASCLNTGAGPPMFERWMAFKNGLASRSYVTLMLPPLPAEPSNPFRPSDPLLPLLPLGVPMPPEPPLPPRPPRPPDPPAPPSARTVSAPPCGSTR
jgi:hypothetical protein